MTREEREDAIKFFEDVAKREVDNAKYSKLAIEALEQEPTTKNDLEVDCISRQAVLDLIADYDLSMGQVVRGIHALPPITPQEPRWIPVSERLPEDYEDVLVSGEDIVKQAQFIKGIFECEDDGVYALLFGCKADGVYALLSDEKVIDADFTFKALAWRPLPKPYESQESEDKEQKDGNEL